MGDAAYRCDGRLGGADLWAYRTDHTVEVSIDRYRGDPASVLSALVTFELSTL